MYNRPHFQARHYQTSSNPPKTLMQKMMAPENRAMTMFLGAVALGGGAWYMMKQPEAQNEMAKVKEGLKRTG